MQYVAIRLFGDGAMKRHKHTLEPETTTLGDFDSLDEAIEQACLQCICVYLLMGLAWSFIYLTILELFPDAFVGVERRAWLTNFFHMLYFSFITLTTVGYGDVSPAIPLAKFFVFMQSIIGSFYVAILVASLVSAKLSQSSGT